LGARPVRAALDLGLLGDLQRVVNFDAKVSDRTLQLGMGKLELNGANVLRTLVNQRSLSSRRIVWVP